MIDKDIVGKQKKAIELINEIIEDGNKIKCGEYDQAIDRVDRWIERSSTKLESCVPKKEVDKFKIKYTRKNSGEDFILEKVNFHFGKLNVLKEEIETHPDYIFDPNKMSSNSRWEFYFDILHKEVVKTSKEKFLNAHYADSVESAFKELNHSIKEIYKSEIGIELDGQDLMMKAFSTENPVIKLEILDTESNKNIQSGFKFIFAGAMSGIRNPQAHANISITAETGIHMLFLCSLLFEKIENRIRVEGN